MSAKYKNKVYEILITDTTVEGIGVGRIPDGRVVFVNGALTDEIVEIVIIKETSSTLIGKVLRVIKESEERINPDCPYYYQCGGCAFRHTAYTSELNIKQLCVVNALKRIGKTDARIMPILSCSQDEYRNKVLYPVVCDENGKYRPGFYKKHSHQAVAINDCRLHSHLIMQCANDALELLQGMDCSIYDEETGKGLLRHLYIRKTRNDDIFLCVVINGKSLPDNKMFAFGLSKKNKNVKSIWLNINKEKTNVVTGEKYIKLYGDDCLTETVCGRKLEFSASSFFQVNPECVEVLYDTAAKLAQFKPQDTVLDLYCGIGSVGLCTTSNTNTLVGVEIIPQAIENAKRNARLNGRSENNTVFVCGDAAVGVNECIQRFGSLDAVIVDPPRKGLEKKVIETIVDSQAEKVIYISCNPTTLARDIAIFEEKGYKAQIAVPVDMFPRTGHVETVVLLSRKKSGDRINFDNDI